MRLVNGTIDQEGRVEVCVNEVWGSICASGWTLNSAYVVCKQLGYEHSGIRLTLYAGIDAPETKWLPRGSMAIMYVTISMM